MIRYERGGEKREIRYVVHDEDADGGVSVPAEAADGGVGVPAADSGPSPK